MHPTTSIPHLRRRSAQDRGADGCCPAGSDRLPDPLEPPIHRQRPPVGTVSRWEPVISAKDPTNPEAGRSSCPPYHHEPEASRSSIWPVRHDLDVLGRKPRRDAAVGLRPIDISAREPIRRSRLGELPWMSIKSDLALVRRDGNAVTFRSKDQFTIAAATQTACRQCDVFTLTKDFKRASIPASRDGQPACGPGLAHRPPQTCDAASEPRGDG